MLELVVPDELAVAINVTAVQPAASGFLTVFPCLEDLPLTSNLNYRAGKNVANLAIVAPGESGTVCIHSSAETDLVVDLAGTFASTFVPRRVPVRLVDTRAVDPLTPGRVLEIAVGDASGAVISVVAVDPRSDGYLTVFPCGAPAPVASNVNYRTGENRANLVMVRPGVAGRVCLVSSAEIDVVVDLSGVFGPGFVPEDQPIRLVDTRLLP
jgi:hypothetical protein